jgi:hypothetical protein
MAGRSLAGASGRRPYGRWVGGGVYDDVDVDLGLRS